MPLLPAAPKASKVTAVAGWFKAHGHALVTAALAAYTVLHKAGVL